MRLLFPLALLLLGATGCDSSGICMEMEPGVCGTNVEKSRCKGTWGPHDTALSGGTKPELGKATCAKNGYRSCSESSCRR
jgi:hypothetical protein